MTKILIKRLHDKVLIPKYETPGSSGMDIHAYLENKIEINPGEKALIPTGFALSIPKGFEIQIRPRSGLAAKKSISVLNTPGTIDSDYRGEIKVILINLGKDKFIVENQLRIAQMVLSPVIQVELKEVKELSETNRGSGGFGSTGN
jgi:dUTP pyrophosphatase